MKRFSKMNQIKESHERAQLLLATIHTFKICSKF